MLHIIHDNPALKKEAMAQRSGVRAAMEKHAWETAREAAVARLANDDVSKKCLANEPYLVLAFFAQDVRPKTWLSFIGSILEVYDPECRKEWSVFTKMPVWKFDADEFCKRGAAGELYAKALHHRITHALRFLPTLHATVLRIADACPSEASVERAFSTMKRVFGDRRGKLCDERVEMQVQVAAFREPPELPARATEFSPSPRPPRSQSGTPTEPRLVAQRTERQQDAAATDVVVVHPVQARLGKVDLTEVMQLISKRAEAAAAEHNQRLDREAEAAGSSLRRPHPFLAFGVLSRQFNVIPRTRPSRALTRRRVPET